MYNLISKGDSAYPMSRHLIKPFTNPENAAERRFNNRLCAIRTKSTENIIGFLKRRYSENYQVYIVLENPSCGSRIKFPTAVQEVMRSNLVIFLSGLTRIRQTPGS